MGDTRYHPEEVNFSAADLEAEVDQLRTTIDAMLDACADRMARYSDMGDMDDEAAAAATILTDLREIAGRSSLPTHDKGRG